MSPGSDHSTAFVDGCFAAKFCCATTGEASTASATAQSQMGRNMVLPGKDLVQTQQHDLHSLDAVSSCGVVVYGVERLCFCGVGDIGPAFCIQPARIVEDAKSERETHRTAR